MRHFKAVFVFTLLLALLTGGALVAERKQGRKRRFVPNYIAVKDVRLSTANGKALGSLKKSTKVVGKLVGTKVLDVKTADGKYGLATSDAFSPLGRSIKVTEAARKAALSSNRFAFDLYRLIRHQEGNLVFSPASISMALAMTYGGAAGETEREMAAVLHFTKGQHTHDGFSTLLRLANSTGDNNGYSLATANRLWGANGFQFENAFLNLTRTGYQAELARLNFDAPDEARQLINAWVAEQTRQKVLDLIPSGILEPTSKLVLTNAIHFDGVWSSKFARRDTRRSSFYLTATHRIRARLMRQTQKFGYTGDADVQVLSMPYRGNELSMVVVLPRQVEGLAKLERTLTDERIADWISRLRRDKPVDTSLPKFKLRLRMMLADGLKAMGMRTAFTPQADFSAISKSEPLMISQVLHQAFVDVDEAGTEAAAATAVVLKLPGPPPQTEKPILFRADHPFLFFIRDNRTGAILFMGRMQLPEVVE